MYTSQSTTSPAEDTARDMFAAAGYQVTTVPAPKRQDGEFLTLTFGDPRGAAQATALVTRPGSHVEVQRTQAGRKNTRIYLRWTTSTEAGR